MNLTDAQQRAIMTHDSNLIVVAGAGSGKTRVLVERYLALLDANPHWPLNALVAVTFTRKAAQEMRDRVRQSLEERLNRASDADAQRVWSGRLASMESARIDTFHGLCTSILRANAAEARLDPDFGVLDDVDARILLDAVIDDELARLVETNDPALTLFGIYGRKTIVDVLHDFAGRDLPALPDDLMAQWHATWETTAAACIQRLRQNVDFVAALQWEPASGWLIGDGLTEVRDDCLGYLLPLVDTETEHALDVWLNALHNARTAINLRKGSKKTWGDEAFTEAKSVLEYIRNCLKSTLADIGDPPGALDEMAAEMLPLWCQLIARVQEAFASAKRQDSLLDFDDLERMTRQLLHTDERVRARYRQAEFRHLLVDEFQDTNGAQWAIVQALADLHQPGSLFVVGDQKQSIYAFRGADVSVFGQVRQQITAVCGDKAEIALARSFRTHQPLIDRFNAIFNQILARDAASPVFDYETELGEPMDAHRLDAPGDQPALEFVLVETDSADAGRRWEAYEIAMRLRRMVDDETPVFDREAGAVRPVGYGDMALLFQSMGSVTLYEEAFKAAGIDYVTVAGRGYYDRPEVWDLLNLLRALYHPADNLSVASVLRSPLFGLSDDALLVLRLVQDEAGKRLLLWDALNQSEVVPAEERDLARFARDCLVELAVLAGRVTISELLREALDRTGFLATLTGLPDGARRRGNVEKLLAKAESSGKITLGEFEAYLSDLSAREVREGEALLENTGAVTLMTVHASKGLEFPVVVLVDCTWERGSRDANAVVHDPAYGLACKVYSAESDTLEKPFAYRLAGQLAGLRDEAERKRLLYVAATRAQDYLLVSGWAKRNRDGALSVKGWLVWLVDACELGDELGTPGHFDVERAWGNVRVQLLAEMPDDNVLDSGGQWQPTVWDQLQAHDIAGEPPTAPPLLAPLQIDPTAAARHLSVTQLADLGANEFDDYFGQRFRRGVLQDAPGHISPVPYARSFSRLVGEMVHEALRWWQPGADDQSLSDLLESYAWEQGIVDPTQKRAAIDAAWNLLQDYQHSQVFGWISRAVELYRELPFIYNNGQRIIHGVIDLLMRQPGGRWVIVDYKTSSLAHGNDAIARDHARRYHMQVGAYAEAVREQLRVDADQIAVYIHYIRYNLTVAVEPSEWQAALSKMEPYIGDLVGSKSP